MKIIIKNSYGIHMSTFALECANDFIEKFASTRKPGSWHGVGYTARNVEHLGCYVWKTKTGTVVARLIYEGESQ